MLPVVHATELDVVHLERISLALWMVVLQTGLCQLETLKIDAKLKIDKKLFRPPLQEKLLKEKTPHLAD